MENQTDNQHHSILEKLKNISDSVWDDARTKFADKNFRVQRYINHIHNLTPEQRAILIRKIINKYESDEYRDREYRKGYEPRTPLYDVLMDYAEQHCQEADYKKNQYFEEIQYDIDGKFIISEIFGQGSFISIQEIPDDEVIPHIYTEDIIHIYNPKDECICSTRDEITLIDILCQLKEKKIDSGFYVMCNGKRYDICHYKIKKNTEWHFGDTYANKLKELMLGK